MPRLLLPLSFLVFFSGAILRGQSVLPQAASATESAPVNPGVIRGAVVSEGGQAVVAASVTVRGRGPDNAVLGSALTGADGHFRVSGLPVPGRYAVQVRRLGYTPVAATIALTAAAPDVEVGRLSLAPSPVALEGIEVSAERAPVVMSGDRTIYATKALAAAQSGTALDVLRSNPELEVDMNGAISLRGSTSVAIQLNGRAAPIRGEALQNYLQNLPGSRIERVEVVANPSAKYDAQGIGGIVNIVLKGNADLGLSGTLTALAATRGESSGSGRMAYQAGRVTFFGGGSASLARRSANNHDERENLLARPVTFLDLTSDSRNKGTFGSFDGSLEYRLAPRLTAWAAGSRWAAGSDIDGLASYLWMDSVRTPTSRSQRVAVYGYDYATSDATVGLRRQVQPQRDEWSVELRRNVNGNDSEGNFADRSLTLDGGGTDPPTYTLNTSDNEIRQWTLQADATRPLGPVSKLDAGYRGSWRRETNANVLSEAPSLVAAATAADPSAYRMDEDVTAGYLTGTSRIMRVGVQAGLRVEQAGTRFHLPLTDERFDNRYRSLFPSATLTYALDRTRQLRLSYSKRVDRPVAYQLNPDIPATDPLNRFRGNPNLRPRYTHSLSGDASWTGSDLTLRLTPFFRRTVNSWEQVKHVDSAGVSTVTYENVSSIEEYGAGATASLRQSRRLGGYASLATYRRSYRLGGATSLSQAVRPGLYWALNSNLSFKATPRLDLQGMLNYTPPRDIPQGRISGMLMTYVNARQRVLGTRGSVNLSLVDPFDLWRWKFETHDPTHVQTSHSTQTMRAARLGFSWNFGRPPQSARRDTAEEPPQPQQQTERQIR